LLPPVGLHCGPAGRQALRNLFEREQSKSGRKGGGGGGGGGGFGWSGRYRYLTSHHVYVRLGEKF